MMECRSGVFRSDPLMIPHRREISAGPDGIEDRGDESLRY